MPEETVYTNTNEDLINRFMKVCAQAGLANSGVVVDGSKLSDAQYFKGALLARLDKVNPPFEHGTMVIVIASRIEDKKGNGPVLQHCAKYKISRVWYIEKGWYLEFENVNSARGAALYPVDYFARMENPVSAVI